MSDSTPGIRVDRPRTSLWAVVALLSGISLWCPMTVVAAPVLGLRALVEIKANPGMRGRGAALAGIWLGIAGIACWLAMAILWHTYARIPMKQGPARELQAGLAGDVRAFEDGFAAAGVRDESEAFLAELSQRYGRLIEVTQDASDKGGGDPIQGPAVIDIPYVLRFERATVKAEAAFVTFGPARMIPNPVFKWSSLRIIDSERGDLTYPASSRGPQKAGQ